MLDSYDTQQFGTGALMSWGGPDRSYVHMVAKDIISFLEDHHSKLLHQIYYTGNGRVESFYRIKPYPEYR
jgi:hypothetical protein